MITGLLDRLARGLSGTAGATVATGSTTAPGAEDVTPPEAWRLVQQAALLLDVREPAEWDAGHAPGATLMPLGELSQRLGELPRDRQIIAVCRSGNRSRVAAGLLRRAGFSHVHNMAGGMIAWGRAGLPVSR